MESGTPRDDRLQFCIQTFQLIVYGGEEIPRVILHGHCPLLPNWVLITIEVFRTVEDTQSQKRE